MRSSATSPAGRRGRAVGALRSQGGEEGELPEIVSQGVVLDHIPWSRFHWEPGKEWKSCEWIAIDHYLTKRELVEQFGKEPDREVWQPGESDQDNKHCPYRVTEVYYRPTRTVYVVGWQFDELLDVRKDKLGLQGFYPCPRPMMDNLESCALGPRSLTTISTSPATITSTS